MLDFGRCDELQLAVVREVIDALASSSDLNPDDLMVVGASCRDILPSAFGHGFPLRGTTDVDVAIALPDWAPFEELTQSLEPIGTTGIRYLIRSIPVDLVPFGDVEDPTGSVTPTRRDEDMSVFAFREVFDHASNLPLAEDLQVRIPTPAGFCALKMSAWANRSVAGELRDGPDIAAAVHWYAESKIIQNRLYGTDEGTEVLISAEMDVRLASAEVLGLDLAREIGPDRVGELGSRWSESIRRQLTREFGHETIPDWPADPSRRAAVIDALCSGIGIR
jgi:predicted nucleotidyltransferase